MAMEGNIVQSILRYFISSSLFLLVVKDFSFISATTCSNRQCEPVKQCIRYETIPILDSCCPVCVEYGCWQGNVSYPLGFRVPSGSPCRHCFCPWTRTDETDNDGRVQVTCVDSRDTCRTPRCVDATWDQHHCCKICPNGML